MTPERWQLVNEIFLEASLLLSDDKRDALLTQRCDGDDELRREVDSLLLHRREDDSLFSDQPKRGFIKTDDDETSDFADWAGRCLGPYQLKRLLSAGGMGVVFLAEQERPRRDVAIKLLHRGLLFGEARRRFAFEAEILGRLRHPCIAEIYEAGRAALTPPPAHGPVAPMHFFAMEYIEGGRTLIDYAEENDLSLRERLSLFARVCDGVQHGHQKGVIHRDLKPSNILVTVEEKASGERVPLPKIIDFGVAKCTDGDVAVTTMQTGTNEIVGTLQYMAPEQCERNVSPLDIDARADVYALGVILYRLLTGRVPYDVSHMTIAGSIQAITTEEPAPASRFDRKLRGDLETIIAKALSKDRERRYESSAALSGDLHRYLNGEPISARRPTRWVRSMRWVTRHPRISAAAGSMAVAAIVLGTNLTTIWIADSQPDRLDLTNNGERINPHTGRQTRNGNKASLRAYSNKEIRRWTASPHAIRVAALRDRPEVWGGGQSVVLGFASADNSDKVKGLCFYDADSSGVPYKIRNVEQHDIDGMAHHTWPRPKEARDRVYRGEGFNFKDGWVFDIFPGKEHPGDEVVVYFQYENVTQGVLRIYNLNGDLLFQAWQDGGINQVYWMPQPKLLICAAVKGDMYDYEYGIENNGDHYWSIFAIRPVPGDISNGWIHPHAPGEVKRFEGDQWTGDWYEPIWYRVICPSQWGAVRNVQPYLVEPLMHAFDRQDHVQLILDYNGILKSKDEIFSLSFILNESGEIERRVDLGDSPLATQMKYSSLPKIEELELLNWVKEEFPCGSSVDLETPVNP